MRQAWPFLVLAAPDGSEWRVYLDTTFSVRPDWPALTPDSPDALRALETLNMLTCTGCVLAGGTLVVDFGEAGLRVSGEALPETTGEPWWVADVSPR